MVGTLEVVGSMQQEEVVRRLSVTVVAVYVIGPADGCKVSELDIEGKVGNGSARASSQLVITKLDILKQGIII